MDNVKMGYIVQILKQDNLGVIREESTLTEWLFYLDDVSEKLQTGASVIFVRDNSYEQFMAQEVKRVDMFHTKRAM